MPTPQEDTPTSDGEQQNGAAVAETSPGNARTRSWSSVLTDVLAAEDDVRGALVQNQPIAERLCAAWLSVGRVPKGWAEPRMPEPPPDDVWAWAWEVRFPDGPPFGQWAWAARLDPIDHRDTMEWLIAERLVYPDGSMPRTVRAWVLNRVLGRLRSGKAAG